MGAHNIDDLMPPDARSCFGQKEADKTTLLLNFRNF